MFSVCIFLLRMIFTVMNTFDLTSYFTLLMDITNGLFDHLPSGKRMCVMLPLKDIFCLVTVTRCLVA